MTSDCEFKKKKKMALGNGNTCISEERLTVLMKRYLQKN